MAVNGGEEAKPLDTDGPELATSDDASNSGAFLLPLVAAFFFLESLLNVGALIVFHDMVKDRLISRYVAAGSIPHEQLTSAADTGFMVALISAILYAVVQLAPAFFSLRSRRLWIYVADLVWLAILAASGLSSVHRHEKLPS